MIRSAETAGALIRKPKRAIRRRFPTEDKISTLMEGVRREIPVAELCRREDIHPTIYYKWMKDFMEAGKAHMRAIPVHRCTGLHPGTRLLGLFPLPRIIRAKRRGGKLRTYCGAQC